MTPRARLSAQGTLLGACNCFTLKFEFLQTFPSRLGIQEARLLKMRKVRRRRKRRKRMKMRKTKQKWMEMNKL